MREQFDRQLATLRQELVSIYASIDLELHDAVDSLVEGDKAKARRVKKATREIDRRCAELEDGAYNLIVLQNPVASDLRLLQFFIYANFNLARMSNHVRNIAKTTKRCADRNVPGRLLDLLDAQAHLVYRVLGASVQCIVDNDLAEAAELPELDRPVDELYKSFYRTFSRLDADDDIDAASRVIMAARMLERISDNAVEVGERVAFLLTGSREALSVLADMDEEELEDLYASQAPSFTIDADAVARVANRIPELELGDGELDEQVGEHLRQALALAAKVRAQYKAEKAAKKGSAKSGDDVVEEPDAETEGE
ncbi:PhoU domain-containing protein [Olsenella sp. YH-ols2217]|uniref:PhoU domain-containing protein n=1 Tax=Kribbibacterium absianum TaxID=3044210 RepID=A0ABT6ZMJ2_9ACTN|nr:MULTISPECIES: PhoU domain-containing protein [unclassified Olsenella]MDJ1122084.1 PhoU domain-containing protein [Olsenella sp. YH-ols2216]MDJ1130092.1 PhoU domain-containing protein [Olsenella sp. YH-ols2217]